MPLIPSMPEAESALLVEAYASARVILEYGSGVSTQIAAQMRGKYILSVESDREWARRLRQEIAAAAPRSPVTVYHVDIGVTGAWGRPVDDSGWRRYHRYPNAIWNEPFFRHPDVVLIDGRFRPACLLTAMLQITRPVRVLFDDYLNRPTYHAVEKFLQPQTMVGRMAEFLIEPGMIPSDEMGFVVSKFFAVTTTKTSKNAYLQTAEDAIGVPARRSDTVSTEHDLSTDKAI